MTAEVPVRCEVAVIGGGFGGSLLAMCLAVQGREVVLLERDRHPRFRIGESSTPLANLVLEDVSKRYGLDALIPLCRYGTWKHSYPELRCGPKRGFSFFAHEAGRPFERFPDHRNELLVAANPAEDVADTQWLRSDVDQFFAATARAHGVRVLEGLEVVRVERSEGWHLTLASHDAVSADFVIDASGGTSPLRNAVGLTDASQSLATRSRAVFSHFRGVARWDTICPAAATDRADYPFPADAAALHHLTPDGWFWMLRFDHGVTSVGAVLTNAPPGGPAEQEWQTLLERYPSVAAQMSGAEQIRPLVRTGRLQRRARPASGADWALLPGAAYFIDPLLSPGNAHTMYGVDRLSRIFESWPDRAAMAAQLQDYDARLQADIDFLDPLIHGCYRALPTFPLLAAFTMYYFAGAIYSEERRRNGTAGEDEGFLHSHDRSFRRLVLAAYRDLLEVTSGSEGQSVDANVVDAFTKRVASDIEPWNTTGLCHPARENMYRYG